MKALKNMGRETLGGKQAEQHLYYKYFLKKRSVKK